jgi:hypothetical protein
MAGTRDFFPRVPPSYTTAQLVALTSDDVGAIAWCTDWAGGARLVFWNGTAWAALDTVGGGGSGLTHPEVMSRVAMGF